LFFVLSAYLLDRQIALVFIEKEFNKEYWKNYFLRRFLRIYPLFFLALVFHWFFSVFGISTVIDSWMDIPAHLILYLGESIFWSIPVEFKYYFLSPLLMLIFHKYLKWDLKKIMLVFVLTALGILILNYNLVLSRISTLRYLPIFLVGTFISITEVFKAKNIQGINKRKIDFIGILSFVAIIISVPQFYEKTFLNKVNFQSHQFYLPYAILWGFILLAAKYGDGVLKFFFGLRLLRFIGTISFSVYLFHMLFLKIVMIIEMPDYLRIYFFFILTFGFSSLSYLLIEKPLSRIRVNNISKYIPINKFIK